MAILPIGDPADRRLDDYRNVPDPDLIRGRGIFVAEGRLVVRRLLADSPLGARSVMVTEPARASLADVLTTRSDLPVYVVPPAVMNGITGFNIHRGCLAIGERPRERSWQDVIGSFRLKPEATTLVVLERVANADNVGGVFRNAAAFGAGAVLLDGTSTDPLYRKAIRTSMGAVLLVPFARAAPWPDVLHDLRARGLATVALTPAASARSIRAAVEVVGRRRVAVVLGHEGEGLTSAALDACELHVRIPISSDVDSLNVATAAAIALYEFGRDAGSASALV